MKTFGEVVKQERQLNKLTIEEAAHKIGCSYSTLHAIENNQHEPKARTLVRILDAYAINLDYLAPYLRASHE